jgi:hypothetical protein
MSGQVSNSSNGVSFVMHCVLDVRILVVCIHRPSTYLTVSTIACVIMAIYPLVTGNLATCCVVYCLLFDVVVVDVKAEI